MTKSKSSCHAGSKLTFIKIALLLCWPTVYSSRDVATPGGVVIREGPRSSSSGSSFDTPTDAPFGFFVDGSSIPAMNGIYGPKLPHRGTDDEIEDVPPQLKGQVYMGAYRHDSSGWWLVNVVHGIARDSRGPEWVFIDPTGRSRFRHRGAAPVPGYGKKWSHVNDRRARRNSVHVITEHNDENELPRLLAPIPDDRNECVTSFVFEQLLVQLKRQRAAVANAEAIRSKNFNSSNFPEHTCPATMPSCPSATNTTQAGFHGAADVLIYDGAFTEASECFGAAAWHSTHTEEAAEMFLQKSKALRWARDFDGAAAAAQAVLGSCSGPAATTRKNSRVLLGRAHMALGEIYLDLGNYAEAKDSLELAYAAFYFESLEGIADQETHEQLKQLLVIALSAIRRQHFPPVPRLVAPPAQEKDGCILVHVGNHFRTW